MADAERWYEIESNPEVIRFMPWPNRNRPESEQHLHDRTKHTRLWQADDFLALAIELDGVLIGDVSLHLRSVMHSTRSAEISWLLDPAYTHEGYATEATEALLDLAFDELEAQLVVALVDDRNAASAALAERLWFCPIARSGEITTYVLTPHLRTAGRELGWGVDSGAVALRQAEPRRAQTAP
jgi:RimJ/RimL family protein N-acetyltransferase